MVKGHGLRAGGGFLGHLRIAFRAISGGLAWRDDGGRADREELPCGFFVAKQQFQFPRVQPHAVAFRTEIHLYAFILQRDERLVDAMWTVHAVSRYWHRMEIF